MSPMEPQNHATHWAVLIGVNLYADPRDNSLQGAVADVEAMAAFFAAWPHIKVSKLTASKRSAEELQDIPAERPEDLATMENVSALLDEVIRAGSLKKTSHVYIHFSGHGKKNSERELRLGLYRPDPILSPDYKTSMLRDSIDKMIKEGMKVTVMLDCCFSAGVRRTGHFEVGQVRFLKEHFTMEEGEEPILGGLSLQDDSSNMRSARFRVDRLLNPQGYTIITACGQDEITTEIGLEGERRGALSYFLLLSLQFLRNKGSQVTLPTLHEHLQNRFRSHGLSHIPRYYGSSNICFFESLLSEPDAIYTALFYYGKAREYILNAGLAHGVSVGDRYEAKEWWTSEQVQFRSSKQPYEFVIEKTRSLTSVMKLIGSLRKGDMTEESWKAKPTSFASRQKVTVHIMGSLPQTEREQLQRNLLGDPSLEVSTTNVLGGLPTFNVELDTTADAFRVLDGAAELLPHVPRIQRSARDAMDTLTRILKHLSRYKFLEGFANLCPDPAFEKSFSTTCANKLGDDGRYHVEDGDSWKLDIKNHGSKPLYVHIFNMCPLWSVDDIVQARGEDPDGVEIAPGASCPFHFDMEIPDRLTQSEDVLKFIVTSKPTRFPLLKLPEIDGSGTTRGTESDGFDELPDFIFSGLGAMRNNGDAKWSTRNFTTVTERPQSSRGY